ncbi:MFS transporter [uncultured Nisaea sp.]|uniref:MFS transporter n=1 Tax=uncultured Nisaea sp. TaxID=538215 RepID=UPI0030ED544C
MKAISTEHDEAALEGDVQARSSRWVLLGLALSMLLPFLGVSSANVALPTLMDVFSAPFGQVQWVVLSYLLTITVVIVNAGRLGDLLGHKRVLLGGILLFTAASALCCIAPTLPVLIAARALQGLGGAVLMALTVALVRGAVPEEKTGSAMGLLGSMSAIGTALGPSLGGFLIAGPGWRGIFVVMVPLGIVTFLLVRRYLPEDGMREGASRKGFDLWGTLFLGLTLAAYALALTAGGEHFDRVRPFLILSAFGCGGLFLLVEARASAPLIRLAAFRDVGLSAGLMMTALVSTVMMATLVVGPFYLFHGLGLEEMMVGAVMSVGPGVSILCGVPAGRIVDRLGASATVTAGLAVMAAGVLALIVLPPMAGMAGYIAAIALLAPGYQLFQAANNTSVMAGVPQDRRGVISGLLSLSRNLGFITGASVMGAIFAFASGNAEQSAPGPEAAATGMQASFIVAGALVALAITLSIGSRLLSKRNW